MKAMTIEEARSWCERAGPKVTRDNVLGYTRSRDLKFFISAPDEFSKIAALSYAMLAFRGEVLFSGGLLWLRRWDIGSPQLTRVGWRIIEGLRQAQGDMRRLEVAPAQLFRDDELLELHASLMQVIGFGWIAEFVPSTGDFFLRFKDNRQVCFTAQSAGKMEELRSAFHRWNPTDQDPMIAKLAMFKRARRRMVRS